MASLFGIVGFERISTILEAGIHRSVPLLRGDREIVFFYSVTDV